MRRVARFVAVTALIVAGASYFLPWFTWESDARMEYADRLKHAMSGLPPEYQPRDRYQVRVSRRPAGEAVGWWDYEYPGERSSDAPDVLAVYGVGFPLVQVITGTRSATRIGFAVSGLLIVLAVACAPGPGRRRAWLAAASAAGALGAAAVAVLAMPDFSKYLHSVAETRTWDLPETVRMQSAMQYRVTAWFRAGAASLIVGAVAAVWGALMWRAPAGPLKSNASAPAGSVPLSPASGERG